MYAFNERFMFGTSLLLLAGVVSLGREFNEFMLACTNILRP